MIIRLPYKGCLFCDDEEAKIGDVLDIHLDETKVTPIVNPVRAVIDSIVEPSDSDPTDADTVYLLEVDGAHIPSGFVGLNGCIVADVVCVDCCTLNKERISKLEDCVYDRFLVITDADGGASVQIKDVDGNNVGFPLGIAMQPPFRFNLSQIARNNGLETVNYEFQQGTRPTFTEEFSCAERFKITDNGNGTATSSDGVVLLTEDANVGVTYTFDAFSSSLIPSDGGAPIDLTILNDNTDAFIQPGLYEPTPDGQFLTLNVVDRENPLFGQVIGTVDIDLSRYQQGEERFAEVASLDIANNEWVITDNLGNEVSRQPLANYNPATGQVTLANGQSFNVSGDGNDISQITGGTSNDDPQVHVAGTTSTPLDPFDPSTSALTAISQPAAIAELANSLRAFSQDGTQKTNADDTPFNDPVSQNNRLSVNTQSATHPNTFYVSGDSAGGTGNARFDDTIAVRTNATTNGIDALIWDSGHPLRFNYLRPSSADQRTHILGGNVNSANNPNAGAQLLLNGAQHTAINTILPAGSCWLYSVDKEATPTASNNPWVVLSNTVISTNTLATTADHRPAIDGGTLRLHEGIVLIKEKPADGANSPLVGGSEAGFFVYGGAMYAQAANNAVNTPAGTVVQLTGHAEDILAPIAEQVEALKDYDLKLLQVSPTIDCLTKKIGLTLPNGQLVVSTDDGAYSGVINGERVKGQIELPESRKLATHIQGLGNDGDYKSRLKFMADKFDQSEKKRKSDLDKEAKEYRNQVAEIQKLSDSSEDDVETKQAISELIADLGDEPQKYTKRDNPYKNR